MDIGVSVPFKELKLPWKRKPLRLRFTMRRPTLGTQIRIAREFAKLGVTHEELERQSESERLVWVGKHGKTVSRIVALTLCRGKWSGRWLTGIVAMLAERYHVSERKVYSLVKRYGSECNSLIFSGGGGDG